MYCGRILMKTLGRDCKKVTSFWESCLRRIASMPKKLKFNFLPHRKKKKLRLENSDFMSFTLSSRVINSRHFHGTQGIKNAHAHRNDPEHLNIQYRCYGNLKSRKICLHYKDTCDNAVVATTLPILECSDCSILHLGLLDFAHRLVLKKCFHQTFSCFLSTESWIQPIILSEIIAVWCENHIKSYIRAVGKLQYF